MNRSKFILSALFLAVLAGCAHSTMRGSVAMKINDREAHVCMGNNEAKIGDKVTLYRNVCPGKGGREGGSIGICRKETLGTGSVTELLNEHYSVVKFDSKVDFNESTFVEKN